MDIVYYLKKYHIYILIFLTFLLGGASIGYSYYISRQDAEVSSEELEISNEEVSSLTYHVDIKGSVLNPGVYEVTDNMIVSDVIALAGGLKSSGSTENLNLSAKVKDEMVIKIYTKAEIKEMNTIKVENKDIYVSSEEVPSKVNINTSSKEVLMTLKGIGEAKALDIIAYRDANGLFNNIIDLKNVAGIGDALYDQIKDSITT